MVMRGCPPNASVTQQRAINGNLIANGLDLQNGVELHSGGYKFQGYVPTAPVPEPASMLALGAGAAALLRRRRK